MPRRLPNRRRFLTGGAAALGGMLAGCDRVSNSETVSSLLDLTEQTNLKLQRMLLRADQPAREFLEADISPVFKANGSINPADADYQQLVKNNFARWQLVIDGLVEKPGKFTLPELRAMPSRTQITRHDCVEGWSCIGKWTGVPLAHLLDQVGPKSEARYLVFHCADTMEDAGASLEGSGDDEDDDEPAAGPATGTTNGENLPTTADAPSRKAAQDRSAGNTSAPRGPKYYETIDMEDARHVQTILSYEMNGQTLPVAHGAPLRLRLERQLGYKMAKYVMRIELVDSFSRFGDGKGGYWEDRGYDWYAGI